MKKSLLLSLACLAGLAATAAEPAFLMETYANRISPSGTYGVSYAFGELKLVNLTTGDVTALNSADDYETDYSAGNGNSVTDTGIIVGSINDQAAWLKNGEYQLLNEQIYDLGTSSANGITPDGKRIVGYYSNPNNVIGNYDGIMNIPCYWDVDADGNVSELHNLPYPTKDFTGRAPMYILATAISDDGEIIIGQVNDYSGGVWYPILYSRNAEGEWEYSFPAEKLLNPEHREFPVVPDAPVYPEYQKYMTPSQLEAYNAAMDIYYQTWDEADFPNMEDYMSAAAYAAYTKAMAKYEADNEAYMNAFMAFYDVLEQVKDESVLGVQNSINISPNGKLIAYGGEIPGASFWDPSTYYVVSLDLTTGDYQTYGKELDILPNGINNKGEMFGATALKNFSLPVQSFVKKLGSEEFVPLVDFLSIANEPVANWINENLSREFLTYDPETYEEVTIPYLYTGFTLFSQDFTTLFSGVIPLWEGYEAEFSDQFSYYTTGMTSGVKTIGLDLKENVTVTGRKGGVLSITGAADTVTVYDLSGREVFAGKAASTVATGLPSGFYLVKTEGAAGVKTTKVSF